MPDQFPERTELQEEYHSTYAYLGILKRAGQDVEGNAETDQLRTKLYRLWLRMSKSEKEPFLAPMCLDRIAEGPVDRMFASMSPQTKDNLLEMKLRNKDRLRVDNFNLRNPRDCQKPKGRKKKTRASLRSN